MLDLPETPVRPWQHTDTRANPAPLPARADVCVVGAGVSGLAAAAMLAERGYDVAVLEARFPAAGTTGRSSAKVSVLHQHNAEKIASRRHADVAERYVAANEWGRHWIAEHAAGLGNCGWESCDAITYATDPDGERAVERECELLAAAGLDPRIETLELPWGTHVGVVLPGQAQFDPLRFIDGMVDTLRAQGVSFHHPVRVTGVDEDASSVTVETSAGSVTAAHAVVATGLPFLDRGLHFARTDPRMSHVVGVRVHNAPPPGMYISTGDPVRSVRTAVDGTGNPIVLVGGEGHRTGTETDTIGRQRTLAEWAHEHFGVIEVTHRFSAEDYTTPDHMPFAGPIRAGADRIHVVTGLNKWGFTNAPAAAAVVVDHIDDSREPRPWSDIFSATRVPTSALPKLAGTAVTVAREALSGWTRSLAKDPLRPGLPLGAGPERPCAASGVCPHLGGIVRWNEAAGTWDCPLHGSRFDEDGSMVHGPATKDLLRRSARTPEPR